jgi:hypothetical protein
MLFMETDDWWQAQLDALEATHPYTVKCPKDNLYGMHMLMLDGAYLVGTEPPVFRRIAPPGEAELQAFVEQLAERIGRALERRGVVVRDAESSYLELEPAAGGSMADLLGHSITCRVAVGPRAGQKVFSLQTVPAREERPRKGVAQYAGFSLHGGIGVEADQRGKLERLARYVSRPPVSVERLSLTAQGKCVIG